MKDMCRITMTAHASCRPTRHCRSTAPAHNAIGLILADVALGTGQLTVCPVEVLLMTLLARLLAGAKLHSTKVGYRNHDGTTEQQRD